MTIKPYKFNNYEGTLPEQRRGNYQSFLTHPEPTPPKNLEKIDGIQITIDLTNVSSKQEVCEIFYRKLGFAPREGG